MITPDLFTGLIPGCSLGNDAKELVGLDWI
jgi:hypothetical protein